MMSNHDTGKVVYTWENLFEVLKAQLMPRSKQVEGKMPRKLSNRKEESNEEKV